MTSWIFGFIGAAIVLGLWWFLGTVRERKRREEILRRRDRTGRHTVFGNTTERPVPRQHSARTQTERPEHISSPSVDHATTMPASFMSHGDWSSHDSCLPSNADSGSSNSSSCDSGTSSSSSD